MALRYKVIKVRRFETPW